MRKIPAIIIFFLSSTANSYGATHDFGIEMNLSPTVDSSDNTNMLSSEGILLYQLNNDWQLGAGVKYRYSDDIGNNTVSDMQLRYHAFQNKEWGFDLGAGMENSRPKLLYHFLYKSSPQFSLRAGLNTIFDKNDNNRLEAVLGFDYFFSSENENEFVVEPEPILSAKHELDISRSNIKVSKEASDMPALKKGTPLHKREYQVKEGDWLLHIARTFNTSVAVLLKMNHDIKNPDLIYPNQIIHY